MLDKSIQGDAADGEDTLGWFPQSEQPLAVLIDTDQMSSHQF